MATGTGSYGTFDGRNDRLETSSSSSLPQADNDVAFEPAQRFGSIQDRNNAVDNVNSSNSVTETVRNVASEIGRGGDEEDDEEEEVISTREWIRRHRLQIITNLLIYLGTTAVVSIKLNIGV